MSLNEGEIGQVIRVDCGENVSAATPQLVIEPQLGDLKTFGTADGVTIPAVNVSADGITYLANQYIEYTTQNESDLDYIGHWRKKAILTFSASSITQTDYTRFTVKA